MKAIQSSINIGKDKKVDDVFDIDRIVYSNNTTLGELSTHYPDGEFIVSFSSGVIIIKRTRRINFKLYSFTSHFHFHSAAP